MFVTKDADNGKRKYAGSSRAKVLDTADPEMKGRIRVDHPLLGETAWMPYLTAPGSFFIPEPGDVVYVQCDAGYETHPYAWGSLSKGIDESLEDLPDVFQRVNPTNRGLYSPGGHLFEMDDGDSLTTLGKGFRFTTTGQTQFLINDDEDSLTLQAAFGDVLSVSAADGIQASTPSGVTFSMKAGKLETTSQLDTTITALKFSVTANTDVEMTSTSSMAFVTQGSFGITAPTGPISINSGGGDTNIFATNMLLLAGGAQLKLGAGKVALGAAGTELIDQVTQAIGAFIDNAPTIVSTSVGPGVLSPAVVTLLTTIKTALLAIKGSL